MLYVLLLLPVLYCIAVVVYRIYFHPLSSVPGPLLAAATHWYEFYYDVILHGETLWKVGELHKKYGPVVRISPREVHVDDLGIYHEVYKQNTTFLKDAVFYHAVTAPQSLISIIDPVEHRARRELVAPFFSKRAIYGLDSFLGANIEKLCVKLREMAGDPILLQDGLHCLSVDVISAYLFGKSFNVLDEPNFNVKHIRDLEKLIVGLPMLRHFPILGKIGLALPMWLAAHVAPGVAHLNDNCSKIVKDLLANRSSHKRRKSQSVSKDSGLVHQNIYDALLDAEGQQSKGKQPLGLKDLIDESILFLSAGTETVSLSLTMAIFHVCNNQNIEEKLRRELDELKEQCSGQDLSLKSVEQLPYLTGVIKEAIRFSEGLPGRVPRVVPSTGAKVGNVYLPPGTIISMSNYFVNHNPELYPEPFRFWPERWVLCPPPDKWFVPFSKGSRACVGLNLAYAELYMTLATLFMKFDFELYNTTAKDMEWRDYSIPMTNGRLRVIATPR